MMLPIRIMLSCKLLMIGQTKFLYNLGKSMVVNELFMHIGQLMIIDVSLLFFFLFLILFETE